METAGDRPRSGGLVETSLFSNMARRLRTPPDILLAGQPSVALAERGQVAESCPKPFPRQYR